MIPVEAMIIYLNCSSLCCAMLKGTKRELQKSCFTRPFLVGKIKLVFRCAPAKPDVERKTGHEYYKHVQTYVPEVGATDQE